MALSPVTGNGVGPAGESLRIVVDRKAFDDPPTVALRGFSVHAKPGEFVAIVGPSGAGKSTVLAIAAGLDRAFEGRVEHGGGVAGASSRTAFVFQTPRLMPWLTVLENVALVLDGAGDTADEGAPDPAGPARALLDRVGLGEFADAYPNRLSGGMQRRVALARAFVVDPGLLLMDEPFVSLDDPLAWRLRALLLELWTRTRPTVLYVTHDLREAIALADRVLFLSARPGRVVFERRIDLPRPRVPNGEAIERIYRSLLDEHPRLLSGELATGAVAPGGPAPAAATGAR